MGYAKHHGDGASAGFTLFELIIVMLIVAIMAAIAIPSFKYVTTSNRMASEANALLGDMRFARTEAIKEGLTVTVCASSNPTASTPTCSLGSTPTWQSGRNRLGVVRVRPAGHHFASSRL